ncbi:MAG: histidine kinase dimerization/phospho-acceptor domain-containing protein [Myxococcota bacterium]
MPTFPGMVVRLLAATLAVVTVSAGLTYATAWSVLPLRGDELDGVLRLAGIIGGAVVVAVVLSSLVLLRGLPGLYRFVAAGEGRLAPNANDAFLGPARVTTVAALTTLVLILLDAVSGGRFSGIVGPRRYAVDVLTFGVFQSGLLFGAQAWRALMWAWLSKIHPKDVSLTTRPTLARRYALRVASSFAFLGCAVISVPLAYLSTAQELTGGSSARLEAQGGLLFLAGATTSVVVAAAAAVYFGWRIGSRIAADVADLNRYVGSLGGAEHRWSTDAPQLARKEMRTVVADGIAERARALSAKYARMARDETRARRAIEDMQRLKSRFIAFMSHDLRSPLNSITGFADILGDEVDGPLNSEQHASVWAIRDSGQVLVRLVTDIVDTARVEAGRLELIRESVAVGDLIADAVADAKATPGRGPEFEVVLSDSLPAVEVDRDRMTQALVGVLSHVARMAMQGRIRVRASETSGPPGPASQIRIEINAQDLPPEDTQRIFVAFREIKRPSGRRVGGLGLGLALARTLVAAHGGDLFYESTGPEGASFTFALPAQSRD